MQKLINYLDRFIELTLELLSNQMTATVVSGVLVYICSQLFIEYVLQPIKDYKLLKAKIAYTLTYNAQYYRNAVKWENDKNNTWLNASKEVRKIAAEMEAFAQIRYKICWSIFIPHKRDLLKVKKALIGISNSFYIAEGEGHLNRLNFQTEQIEIIERILKLN